MSPAWLPQLPHRLAPPELLRPSVGPHRKSREGGAVHHTTDQRHAKGEKPITMERKAKSSGEELGFKGGEAPAGPEGCHGRGDV